MAQTLPKPALRPFLAADTPILAAIFVAAVEGLTGDDRREGRGKSIGHGRFDPFQKGFVVVGEEGFEVGEGVAHNPDIVRATWMGK